MSAGAYGDVGGRKRHPGCRFAGREDPQSVKMMWDAARTTEGSEEDEWLMGVQSATTEMKQFLVSEDAVWRRGAGGGKLKWTCTTTGG
jgi:hypothetical protein